MAFIPAPQWTVRCAINQSLEGQEVVNILYFHTLAGAPTAAELEELAATVGAAWTADATGVYDWCNEDLVCENVTVTDVTLANGLQWIEPIGVAGQGGAASHPLNNTLAAVASLRTGFSGRSFRGRLYIAGVDVAAAVLDDGNHITPSAALGISAGINSTAAAAEALAPIWNFVVASYFTRPVPNVVGAPSVARAQAIVTPVTSVATRTLLGNQRRRQLEA